MKYFNSRLIWPEETAGGVLRAHRGMGPGFNYLRILLALLVFHVHSSAIVNGRPAENLLIVGNAALQQTPQWLSWREPLYTLIVPAFFALSGFLVAGSALRVRDVGSFLAFRGLRIFPALAVEVALSALILGPFFTTSPLIDYFGSAGFLRYLGNILGFVVFELPGVFGENPVPRIVNNSLWTLPPEFYCYLIISALMLTRIFYNPKSTLAAFLGLTIVLIPLSSYYGYGQQRGNLPVPIIVYYFFVGCFLFNIRDKLPVRLSMMVFCVLAAYIASYFRLVMVAPIFVTYVIISLGVARWPTLPLVKRGDYSYGIYLYHFPIAQALVSLYPWFLGHPYLFKVPAIVLTVAFAVMSWHLLEKPALRLKKRLVRAGGGILAEPRGLTR